MNLNKFNRWMFYAATAGWICLLVSCPNPVTEEMLLQVKDILGPAITITSPEEGSLCCKTVIVTGTVSDSSEEGSETGEVHSITYEILSTSISGSVDFDEEGAFSFSFDTSTLATSFVLKVNAVDWNGNSGDLSITLNLLEGNDIPTFTATPGDNRVVLEWEDVPFTQRYNLYYTTNGTLPSENFGMSKVSITSPYTLSDLDNGSMCVFRLLAVPEEGYPENWSGYEMAIPLSVQTLAPVISGGCGQIEVQWPSIPATDEFEVYKSTQSDSGFVNITGSYTGTTFIDTDVENSTWYYYKINPAFSNTIQSISTGGESSPFISGPDVIGSVSTSSARGHIAVAGNYAYLGDFSDGFKIIDISNRESPRIVKTIPMGDYVFDVDLWGSYALVAASTDGLHIVDISDPETASIADTITVTGSVRNVRVSDGYAYFSDSDGFKVLDIDPIASASVVKTIGGYNAADITVLGGYVYIASGSNLVVIDITPPESASVVRTEPSPSGTAKGVGAFGDVACITVSSTQEMYIFDISTPASASYVATVAATDYPYGVEVKDHIAYVAVQNTGLQIFNIEDPASAEIIHTIDTSGVAYDVALYDQYACVADALGGLAIIDITDPGSASIEKTVPISTARNVVVDEGYAYVAGRSNGLLIVDIKPPGAASVVKTVDTGYASDVAVCGDFAYVADYNDGLVIVDISSPTSAASVHTVAGTEDAAAVTLSGGYAYIANSGDKLQIVDIDDPLTASLVESVLLTDSAVDVAVSGNYAYVAANNHPDAGNSSHLWIIDISDPTSASVETSFVPAGYAAGVAVSGNYAYVADLHYDNPAAQFSGLSVVNIQNPSSPSIVGSVDTTTQALGITISGAYAYLANNDNGLKIINIDDPLSPKVIKTIDTTSAYATAVSGKYAYVADNNDGLIIIDLLPE